MATIIANSRGVRSIPIGLPGENPVNRGGMTPDEYFQSLDLNDDGTKKDKNSDLSKARSLTIKGAPADDDQRKNMELVISTAREVKGSTDRTVLAVIEAVIVESQARNLKGGDNTSSGILQLLSSTGVSHNVDPRDIEACVTEFMKNGFYIYGGAIKIGRAHKDYSPGDIAWRCQGPREDLRGEYSKYYDEAVKWLEAAEGGRIEGGSDTYRKAYQYKREKGENSWDAMQRLAEEVKWRCFPVGRAMYYMSEVDLFSRRIRYVLTPQDPSIIDFNYEIDWRKKVPVNEGTLQINLDRWGAAPGSVISLEGWGPPDGRWLVVSVRRDWFSPIAEVTIRQPLAPELEPAADIESRTPSGGESDTGTGIELYRVCRRISDAGGPYLYGGAHGKPLSQINSKDPMDCSSSTSLALYRAKCWDHKGIARISGEFSDWGRNGRGNIFTVCYSDDHVYIRFEPGASVDAKRFDTSPWGDTHGSGPRLRTTQGRPDDNGMHLRHWPDN